MFHNKSSTMAHRSRIPVRRTVAAINDENKVGAPAAQRSALAAVPVKAVGAARPVVPAGARLAAKPAVAAAAAPGPAKVFGASAVGASNVRPRSVLDDIGKPKPQGIVSRLTKPNEIANRLPAKAVRVAASGIAKPTVLGPRARQPAVVAAAAAAAARPVVSAVRAPVLSARPISKPGPSFGMRRPAQPYPPAAPAAPVPVVQAAAPAEMAQAKRIRTAPASNAAQAETALGKHTRSGRITRCASSDTELQAAGDRLDLGVARASESADEVSSTVVGSSASSLCLGGAQLSPGMSSLGDLKFVDVDTIDYALVHTGLLNEVPITMAEINAFEADVDPMDPTLVPEFSDDIFGYMRELEVKMMPDAQYIVRQPRLTWSTRAVLVEWLVQVHQRFDLLPETLYLCINFVDRFLSMKEIAINKLQLVGAVCLLLASKYEEIHVPSVGDMVYMVEKHYSADEIMRAERYILKMLNFDLGWPGPLSFLRRISKADEYDMATRTLAKYLIEVTLIDERFIGIPSSKVAATAHFLSRQLLDKGPWTRAHAFYSGYFESELLQPAAMLIEQLMQPRKHGAIFEKYGDRRFLRASQYVHEWFRSYRPESLLQPTAGDHKPAAAGRTALPAGAEVPIF